MVAYTDSTGTTYDMPELDASMYAKQAAADGANDIAERAKAAWAFLRAALPADAMAAEFGTTDQRKASVPRILTVYAEVVRAYWAEYDEVSQSEIERQIGSLGELPKVVDMLSALTRA